MNEGLHSFLKQAISLRNREFRIIEPSASVSSDIYYAAWIVENTPNPLAIRDAIKAFAYTPKISIVMPVFDTPEQFLVEAIESVRAQLYENWELCICDNGSTRPGVKRILQEASGRDGRIKVVALPANKGIAAGTNAALAPADGEFTGFLDHDDVLYPDALFEIVKLLNHDREIDYIYSDEDKIDLQGRRVEPFFKPDWSPDLLLSVNYVTHFSVYRTSLLHKIGGVRDGYEGSQDYDLVLRATERTNKIQHIKKPLYGWRISTTSTSGFEKTKPMAHISAVKALQDAMKRRHIEGRVEILPFYRYRVKYAIKGSPEITIIIPTRTAKYIANCVKSILRKTRYDKYEILVVDNGARANLSKTFQACRKVKIISDFSHYNFSRMNNEAAKVALGDYLVFLNDDTEVISDEWLSAMLEHAQREEVGAVGARLLNADGIVQHAGIIVGIRGFAANYGGMSSSDPGYFWLPNVIRNCAAVTGACMMVRKSYFIELGGFDESLGHSWNDVDFGIRVLRSGRWLVYTPFALLYHLVGGTRGADDTSRQEIEARERFRKKHLEFIGHGDPFYNPNFSTEIPYMLRCEPKALAASWDPSSLLWAVYQSREDLKTAFPEARSGDYTRLLRWAASISKGTDSSWPLLGRHQASYRSQLLAEP